VERSRPSKNIQRREVFGKLGSLGMLGMLGMAIPEDYGGSGLPDYRDRDD
jgi:alkylation response protein AidB-like acyl-CoA dehydrogenase